MPAADRVWGPFRVSQGGEVVLEGHVRSGPHEAHTQDLTALCCLGAWLSLGCVRLSHQPWQTLGGKARGPEDKIKNTHTTFGTFLHENLVHCFSEIQILQGILYYIC